MVARKTDGPRIYRTARSGNHESKAISEIAKLISFKIAKIAGIAIIAKISCCACLQFWQLPDFGNSGNLVFMLGVLTSSLVAAAAASYAGYATMAPTSQLYGRTLTHGADPAQIALTFDDGPNDPHTLRLLDVLARHQAKATFFLIGQYVRQRPEIARAVQAAGQAIGNHTYGHPNLIFVSASRLRQELEDCRKALEDAIGQPAPLFRPPFGGRRPNVLRTARAMGLEPVMWSVTGYDWNPRSAKAIVQ